jgi:hypothetical protein
VMLLLSPLLRARVAFALAFGLQVSQVHGGPMPSLVITGLVRRRGT